MPARKKRTRAVFARSPELNFDALEWRNIGPWRGGRVGAVAADPNDTQTFYLGSTRGGGWESTGARMYWEEGSGGLLKRAAVGALALAQAPPHRVYAPAGEDR